MHICGTCIHSRVVEEYGLSGGCVAHYECALQPGVICDYHGTPCDSYEPDQDYIDLMGFEEEE